MKRQSLVFLVLQTGLLGAALAASGETQSSSPPAPGRTATVANVSKESATTAKDATWLHFGPAVETLLPDASNGRSRMLFDLETGRQLPEPPFESFGNDTVANITWLKTNGVDLCGLAYDGTNAACIAYYLAAVPVESRRWENITPSQVAQHPGLAMIRDPKRTTLSPELVQTDTFLFRTREGAVGILQILGVGPDRRSVKLRYKLATQQVVAPTAVTLAGRVAPGT